MTGPRALWERLAERLLADPGRIAVARGEDRLSAARLVDLARRPLGGPGERVRLTADDPLDLLLDLLSCWRTGAVPFVRWRSLPDGAAGPGQGAGPREGLVIPTSGTSGLPKPVALPADGLALNAATIAGDLGFSPADRICVCTPLTYMYGLMGATLPGLWAGAEVHLFAPGTVPTVIQAAIRALALTVVQGPPSTHRLHAMYWNGRPFESVRLVSQGGEHCERALADWMAAAYPLARRIQVYGMTEAGPRLSHLDMDGPDVVLGQVGRPFTHFDWRLERAPGSPPDAPGRLVFAGPGVMLGYPRPDGGYDGLDAEGFFASGDRLREDARGRLFFDGRLDRCFKCGGRFVYPGLVERALIEVPGVRDALCVAEPDPVLGLVPVARLVAGPGRRPDAATLRAACAGRLETFQVPRRFDFVERLELAPSGKRKS